MNRTVVCVAIALMVLLPRGPAAAQTGWIHRQRGVIQDEPLLRQHAARVLAAVEAHRGTTRTAFLAAHPGAQARGGDVVWWMGPASNRFQLIFEANALRAVRCEEAGGDGFDMGFHDDGTLRYYNDIRGGKLEGVFLEFHTNGTLCTVAQFSENKLLGPMKTWGSNGRLLAERSFPTPTEPNPVTWSYFAARGGGTNVPAALQR